MAIDAQGINAKVQQFDTSHGNYVYTNGWLLFEDGAQRENNPLGRLMEPPVDPLKLAKKIEWYWQVKLDLAVEEFDLFKHQHMIHAQTALSQQMAQASLGETAEVVKHLKELKKKVKHCQKGLDMAEAQIEEHKPQRLKELEELSDLNRQDAETLISEIENIEI